MFRGLPPFRPQRGKCGQFAFVSSRRYYTAVFISNYLRIHIICGSALIELVAVFNRQMTDRVFLLPFMCLLVSKIRS